MPVTFRSPSQPRVPDVRKIAVLRANALGDLVFAMPAYEALAAAYPGAEVVLLANPWHYRFLNGRPGAIARVEIIPVSEGVRVERDVQPDPADLARFFERMRAERFDLVVQLHGGGRHSNAFVRRLGARFTVGRRTPDAAPLDRTLAYRHYQDEIARHLETVALAGARPITYEPRLTVIARDFADLAPHFDVAASPYAVIHPGAGDGRRRWPAERFAAVADALAHEDLRVVLVGQRNEQPLVEHVAARASCKTDIVTEISQGALAALLSRAAIVIGNDSGPAHLARACGARTVVVFWGPNAINAAPLSRARHRVALSWQTACPVCGCNFAHSYPYTGYDCGHRESLLRPVPVDEVLREARSLLCDGDERRARPRRTSGTRRASAASRLPRVPSGSSVDSRPGIRAAYRGK